MFSSQWSSSILTMPLKNALLLLMFILLVTLSFRFEMKIDYNLRSVYNLIWRRTLVVANSFSPSTNPFLEDSRKEKRPLVTDRRLRDESLQREFNIDLVS